MKTRHLFFALVAASGFAASAGAQVISYSPRTGDVWVDTELGRFNDYGRRDRDYFVDDLVGSYGAPRYLVNELLDKRRWEPGDVYYAAALAYQARRPLSDVARAYETEGKGKGWGVVAMRMGIKPGSAEFHALKGQMGKSKGRYGSHGSAAGSHPSDKGKDKGHDGDEDGPGNSGKSKDKGDNGKGKGKSKGHGR
jgi:hypothetical protein